MTLYDNVFDSRDAEQRIEELRESIDSELRFVDLGEEEELEDLLSFKEEAISTFGEQCWDDGITFVADHYFQEYAKQVAEDIGAIDPDARWPLSCIDWEDAAEQLKYDYCEISLGADTYWGRD